VDNAGGYPVSVTFDESETMNRLWGIPLLGIVARSFLVIPQWIVLSILGLLLYLSILITWIWILMSGKLPGWAVTLYEGFFRMAAQVSAYVFLLSAKYPPFWISGDHPVKVDLAQDEPIMRVWGFPFLGLLVRSLILIPSYIGLILVGIVAYLVMLISWIPVLLGGKMAGWGYLVLGGYLRWSTRVTAYLLYVTDRYPPFRLGN
jgi:hypothetical protein